MREKKKSKYVSFVLIGVCFLSYLTFMAEELCEKCSCWGEYGRALDRQQVEQLCNGTDAPFLHITQPFRRTQAWQISRQWH